jgi:kynurenine formamidase
MKTMKIIDLSQKIHAGMTVFPGTPGPKIMQATSIAKNAYLEHDITMRAHTGTHVDAPAHIRVGGKSIDSLEPGRFIGKAAVVDFTKHGAGSITIEALKRHEKLLRKIDFLLIMTGWDKYWGTKRYFSGFPVLEPEAARWLGKFKLKGIGVDTITVDPVESLSFPAHKALFASNLVIVENLANLKKLGNGIFLFSCLPLKIVKSGGSPVRAVGIL